MILFWQTEISDVLQHFLLQQVPIFFLFGLNFKCRLILKSINSVICRAVCMIDLQEIMLHAWFLLLLSHAKNLIRHSWCSIKCKALYWKISMHKICSKSTANTSCIMFIWKYMWFKHKHGRSLFDKLRESISDYLACPAILLINLGMYPAMVIVIIWNRQTKKEYVFLQDGRGNQRTQC